MTNQPVGRLAERVDRLVAQFAEARREGDRLRQEMLRRSQELEALQTRLDALVRSREEARREVDALVAAIEALGIPAGEEA